MPVYQPARRFGEAPLALVVNVLLLSLLSRARQAGDCVRDPVRKDQEGHEKHAVLQAAVTQGVGSGVAESFNMDEIQGELDRE